MINEQEIQEKGYRQINVPSNWNCNKAWQKYVYDSQDNKRYFINLRYWDIPMSFDNYDASLQFMLEDHSVLDITYFHFETLEQLETMCEKLFVSMECINCE